MIVHVVSIKECPPFAAFNLRVNAERCVSVLVAKGLPDNYWVREVEVFDEVREDPDDAIAAAIAAHEERYG